MNSYFPNFRWPLTIAAVILVVCLAASTGCSNQKTEAAAPAAQRAVPVVVASSVQRDVPVSLTAIGTVSPLQTVQVKSMVTAQIVSVNFQEGQEVKKGQLLFTLDDRSFKAELAKAEGTLARDRAAAANARVMQKRYQALLKEGVIAQQEYDQQESQAAQYDAAAQADLAAVESAKVNLQYTKIYAPISGRTGDLLVREGNLIKANDLALVVINQIAPIYSSFALPERYLAEVKKYSAGGSLKAVAALPESNIPLGEGRVSFIDNAVDRTTGTIAMKAEFANSERKLWPGQFVNVTLQLTTEKNATVIPTQAIQNGQQGTYVFVVKPDKTAEFRIVELGPTDGPFTLIRKGVAPGETVVTDGQVRLTQGAKVEYKASLDQAGTTGQ